MSLLISQIRLPFPFEEEEAVAAACRAAGLAPGQVLGGCLHKQSLDLRHGGLKAICTVELRLAEDEAAFAAAKNDPRIRLRRPAKRLVPTGTAPLDSPPAVVGFGPAGMFAALALAENGYRPIVLERGGSLEERDGAVQRFFNQGVLDENCNIQFGEGGAGAYSDGKLTTRIGDERCELVLELLEAHGAPHQALQAARPHVGTDLLKGIVSSIRRRIQALGGQVLFHTRVTGVASEGQRLRGLLLGGETLDCQTAVLAIGHSARDSFAALAGQGIRMEPKPFSVGVRIEHLQEEIDRGLYGSHAGMPGLPPGEYSLSCREGERGCYSFCMCPGGQVVAAASQQGGVVTNGMSYHARAGKNANAALCVSVNPTDCGPGPLGGVAFQRELEQAAFALGGGDYQAPVQLAGDFLAGRPSRTLGRVTPTYPRGWQFRQLDQVLPGFVSGMLRRALPRFGRQIPGFDSPDAVLTGVETRTSSPVRMPRGEDLFSVSLSGLIPCGEGAGYAGGIMSAAVDGLRAAERIMSVYRPLEQ